MVAVGGWLGVPQLMAVRVLDPGPPGVPRRMIAAPVDKRAPSERMPTWRGGDRGPRRDGPAMPNGDTHLGRLGASPIA